MQIYVVHPDSTLSTPWCLLALQALTAICWQSSGQPHTGECSFPFAKVQVHVRLSLPELRHTVEFLGWVVLSLSDSLPHARVAADCI